MEKMTNNAAFNSGLVAIIRSATADQARENATALIAEGIEVIEFTTTTPAVFELIEEFTSDSNSKHVHVGLGTAMNRSHVL